MEFTFGIATGGNDTNINLIIDSIERQNIPLDKYEVIIVGKSSVSRQNTKVIPFQEHPAKAWITRKKNLITEHAKFENIVYLHDYVVFEDGWYENWLEFGDDFAVCMNRIENPDGSRFRDWVLCFDDVNKIDPNIGHGCLLPYEVNLSKYMYFSGTYWVAKKEMMQKYPLDETLFWGESEDIVWSRQVRKDFSFSINPKSVVRLLKHKDPIFHLKYGYNYGRLT